MTERWLLIYPQPSGLVWMWKFHKEFGHSVLLARFRHESWRELLAERSNLLSGADHVLVRAHEWPAWTPGDPPMQQDLPFPVVEFQR